MFSPSEVPARLRHGVEHAQNREFSVVGDLRFTVLIARHYDREPYIVITIKLPATHAVTGRRTTQRLFIRQPN